MRKRRRREILIETDVFVAAIDHEDPHHEEAREVITGYSIVLSPYTLIEMDLLIRSRIIIVKDYCQFWYKVHSLLDQYKIRIIIPSPLHHAEAQEIRARYDLTYFDSLHAAVAIVNKMKLVSYDEKAYGKIKDLNYAHPHTLIMKDTFEG